MKNDAERKAYEQGQEDGYSKGWVAGNEHEDALDAEIAKLKAERDAAYATSLELEKQSLTAYVRGLEWAKEIVRGIKAESEITRKLPPCDFMIDAIQAEIDKAKAVP